MPENQTRLQYNGLTIDPTSKYSIYLLEGLDGLDIRTSSDLSTVNDGGFVWLQKYGMRQIAFEGTVSGTDSSDYFIVKRALLSAFSLNTSNILTVRLWDGTERNIVAYVVQQPQTKFEVGRTMFTRFRIELLCPDPFFSDVNIISINFLPPVISGFSVPLISIPFSLGTVSGGTGVIINAGDIPNYASFRITGACENPIVTNTTTGESFQLFITLLSGEYIDIFREKNNFYITKNGGGNFVSSFAGTFFLLQKGSNTFTFNASTYDSSCSITINFTNKYISL